MQEDRVKKIEDRIHQLELTIAGSGISHLSKKIDSLHENQLETKIEFKKVWGFIKKSHEV